MSTVGNILVIDDDGPIAEFIADALTDEGYSVHSVTNGDNALAAAAAQRPDLILCDLYMPIKTGMALVKELHDSGLTDVPVILMTADATAMQRLTMEGIAFCLIKPFDLDELLDCVATYIRHQKEVM